MSDRQARLDGMLRYLGAAYYQAVRGEARPRTWPGQSTPSTRSPDPAATPRGPARVKAAGSQPEPARWPATAAAGGYGT